MEDALSKAIEAGFIGFPYGISSWAGSKSEPIPRLVQDHTGDIVMCPLFWQALGKALGWEYCFTCPLCKEAVDMSKWEAQWHKFITHLDDGGDAETFFKELLAKN